jgi:hypothetical protein
LKQRGPQFVRIDAAIGHLIVIGIVHADFKTGVNQISDYAAYNVSPSHTGDMNMSHRHHSRHKGHGGGLITLAYMTALLSVVLAKAIYRLLCWICRGRGNDPERDGTPGTGEPSPVAPRRPDEQAVLSRLPNEQRERIIAAIQAIERGRLRRAAVAARRDRFWNEQVYHRASA